jgi:hypothetical protein
MMLALDQAVHVLLWLAALSLLIQCAEALRLQAEAASLAPWPWDIQRDDLKGSSALVRSLFDRLYQPRVHRAQLIAHALLAASLPTIGPTIATSVALVVSQVIIAIRSRGAFNGGSDFMTLAVLTGIAVGTVCEPWLGESLAWQAGLWLISIQALSSYFLSGTVKLRYAGWRNGRALPALLSGGIYGPLPASSLLHNPPVAIVCSWGFIIWEAAFPLAMIDPRATTLWCGIGAVFHLLVWWYFGLNRFFWAWLATFPALIGCATLVQG